MTSSLLEIYEPLLKTTVAIIGEVEQSFKINFYDELVIELEEKNIHKLALNLK